MSYSDRFRADFEKMEKEYLQSLEEKDHKRSKSFLYVAAAVIAAAIAVVTVLDSRLGLGDPVRKHNVTEIPWTPVKLGTLPSQATLVNTRR
jgi:hypothetical protein